MTDALHLKAIEIIAGALRGSVAGDAGAGEAMALGQYVAGMGFSNVGLGLVHGMAHPLGAFYNTPHGVANAILLPHVMRFNAEATGEKYRDIARAMGVKGEALSLSAARLAAVEAVCQLNRDVGIPGHLREVDVRKEDIPALARAALADVYRRQPARGEPGRYRRVISGGLVRGRPGEAGGAAAPAPRLGRVNGSAAAAADCHPAGGRSAGGPLPGR